MNENLSSEKPCLVPAKQGFSVLYQNRYLYSRYNPESVSLKAVEALNIQEETLVLVFSPLLCYGLPELLQKVPKSSFVLLIEKDPALSEISKSYIKVTTSNYKNVTSILVKSESDYCWLFDKNGIFSSMHFRRCVPIELSGGAKLFESFYRSIINLTDIFINQFWRNRITLVKLGRLYARNLIKNLSKLPQSKPLLPKSVANPILVCGSGPSLDKILPKIANEADRFFVLAVDNALMPLLKNGIIPDAVLAVECQLANEKAFIGAVNTSIPVIADLTSRPHILSLTGGSIQFFLSEYENMNWLKRVQEIILLNPIFPPLGSVGLTAMDTALYLRSDYQNPIFFCGLDFSFKPAKTHCRETPAHRFRLDNHNRLNPLENLDRSFTNHTFYIKSKDGTVSITDPSLSGYGKAFSTRYPLIQNIYDISPEGMDTLCPKATVDEMILYAKNKIIDNNLKDFAKDKITSEKVLDFYTKEEEKLERLKFLLVNGGSQDEIIEILKECDYLYIHFADGYKEPSCEKSFLNRVRSEIDFFLKDIRFGKEQTLKNCSEK